MTRDRKGTGIQIGALVAGALLAVLPILLLESTD